MFSENIEMQKTNSEVKKYNFELVKEQLLKIKLQEELEEPRNIPGEDLKPRDQIILSKLGYKDRSDVPYGR